MFISVKELERHPLTFREQFAPGTIDFRAREFRQALPLDAQVTAELAGGAPGEIRIRGRLETHLEVPCARCLEPVAQAVAATFDLVYRPVASIAREEEVHLSPEDAHVGFYPGDGLFLADVVAEQVTLAVPMKTLCRPDCRGLCAGCGANLNRENCRCGPRALDPRLAPLAEFAARKRESK
jgi:uncharacterized protein